MEHNGRVWRRWWISMDWSNFFDKDNGSLWRTITVPAETEFFLLKRNQLHFGQSEHESAPFTMELMNKKSDCNTSTERVEEVLKGTYDNDGDAKLTDIMKLVLTNYVQITWQEKTSSEMIGFKQQHY